MGAIRHASSTADIGALPLCGADLGHTTAPKETVNCPACRVILNHVRDQYPAHARYTDWRLTRKQEREAIQAMRDDMYGGADD